MRTVHYVGMSEARYEAARRVFGGPAYYHKYMDARVYSEVGDSDVVVVGDPANSVKFNTLSKSGTMVNMYNAFKLASLQK